MRRLNVVSASAAIAALLLTGVTAPAVAAEGDELFISEYIEGSSNNKAIEIYNPTDAAVDLTGYAVQMYFNGAVTAALTITLTGSVAAGDVYVVAQATASAAILAQADLTNGAGWFNGDDAIVLAKSGAVIDSLGQIGVDPGTQWGADLASTADNTLRRLPDLCVGDPTASDAFDPATQWEGLATDTFDGLGTHTSNCGGEVEPTVVINEFSANTLNTAPDVEFVELLATPGTDLSAYRVLSIEGDATSAGDVTPLGVVDRVIPFPAPDASGRSLVNLVANDLENGSMSLLLVTGTLPAVATDLDADNNGVIDEAAGITVVDAVAVGDGGGLDATYGGVTLTVGYDGQAFAPGGASRIPDGTDTDTTADWVRNDFDLAGIPGNGGSLIDGEALNTPGAVNAAYVAPDPDQADCDGAIVTIGSVQGAGATSAVVGQVVHVEGIVVADYQATGGLTGYFLQDGGDGDAATSDGIFVYAPGAGALDVSVGNVVNVAGVVSEFASAGGTLTEITAGDAEICAVEGALPAPVPVTLPAGPEVYEPLEGMYVIFPQSLSILEYFEFGRFGSVDVGVSRQMTPTAVYEPGSPEAIELAAKNLRERITLDDGRGIQNPDPAVHPNGSTFTLENSFRGGDLLTNITGVLDYRFGGWTVQPTEGADYAVGNERPLVPEVGGDITVASFNVLNYFTTLGSRGATTAEEFGRQESKIVSALAAIDADVVGLIEIENNGTAVATLTAALNAVVGAGTYAHIETGVIGTDEIATALIYKPATVVPLGEEAVLTSAIEPDFADNNRPALAQTFAQVGGSESVNVVVNHLKSKGSACAGDPDLGDGAGNCNITRTKAAAALARWLATNPTGQGAGRELIMGDLNSYDKEDPIDALRAAGYADMLLSLQGENAYSYVFDGQLGYLDYAMANTGLVTDVTGAAVWRINADEPSLIDYDMDFKLPAQDALWAPDPFRSSDHDPVLVGLELTPPDTTPPTITATVDPAFLFPPNGKPRTVTVTVAAADELGPVTVVLVSATATGNKKAAITQVGDTTSFSVIAAVGSLYTITYKATDAAGNTAESTATVRVGP